MAKTTGDVIVEKLIGWGVDTVFGLPGDGINGIFESLRQNREKIRFIQVRPEESAAFAACGYAKCTGRFGVCSATSGPGAIHLLNGLDDASESRSRSFRSSAPSPCLKARPRSTPITSSASGTARPGAAT